MSKRKFETIVMKYSGPKGHIEAIKEAAKASGLGSLDAFVHYCITHYLDKYWWPRTIEIPTKLFRSLSKKAEKQGILVDELVTEIILEKTT